MLSGIIWLLSGCGGGTSSSQTETRVYEITDLGRSNGLGLHLNNIGEIAVYQVSGYVGSAHAGLFHNGGLQDLGTLGGVYSYATGINDQGEVIGISEVPYVPGNVTYRAFVWRNAQLVDLGGPSADTDIQATGINDAGQIVGSGRTLGGFLWQDGVFTALPLLPVAINNRGQVLGQTDVGGPSVVWQQGQVILVGVPGSVSGGGGAVAINDIGQVAGTMDVPSRGRRDGFRFFHAFSWQGGTLHDLGTLGGTGSQAYSINNGGEIVGDADTAQVIQTGFGPDHLQHAFLYHNGKMLDLNSLLPARTTWELSRATSINDRGQIVGYGSNGDDLATHAYLLSPQ
jgi:probable HAF family extracellular repeat protein